MTVALYRLRDELGFSLNEVDIDRDPALVERYDTRVPVLAGGDIELCHYYLDEDRLRAWCETACQDADGRE
jgi:hypothetical protein